MSFADECTRVYTRTGIKAHLIPPLTSQNISAALCGTGPEWFETWRCTGSQREIERLTSLPVCKRCEWRARHEDSIRKIIAGFTFNQEQPVNNNRLYDIANGEMPPGAAVKCGNRSDLPLRERVHLWRVLGTDVRNGRERGFTEGTVNACMRCGADKFEAAS